MRKKRIVNVIVAMLVVLGISSTSLKVQAQEYPDVSPQSWYYENVQYVTNKGIMTGFATGYFHPMYNLGRGQAAAVFYRLAGEPKQEFHQYFPDVPYGAYFGRGVIWAYEIGLMTGYKNGNFGPEDPITREQLATVLYRYAKIQGYNVTADGDLSPYPDASGVAPFSLEGMKFAVKYGLISGDGGKLNPRGNVNRAIAATIFRRFDENILSK
ncbi:MAG: S-layer homology domain-containing protein [Faecalicatena sp.]|uniref:S-layer homology domain-containing protein n=1 Tax=Faecalicatena sp. TaxID=2005360 RepID=UPI0025905B68|nr:S-layer homology domain-containing protein [Faecalicatena sp.]MCI6467434.1 S-layer homology domain-containing protein [Faecalicatena sp.]MDY5618132.1 S-layer homology domain-containing protein [Lachnospiraceae bacterium]